MSLALAIDRLRGADERMREAMTLSRIAPPDQGFADRLRGFGEAAGVQAGALEYAAGVGVTLMNLTPQRGPKFPHELTPAAFRPGSEELWAAFDAAAAGVQQAGWDRDIAAAAHHWRQVAELASALAVAVDLERSATDPQGRSDGLRAGGSSA